MNDTVGQAVQVIEKQQKKVGERSAAWMVGEQLKDICRAEPESAGLIAADLEAESMSIAEAEKKIKAYADKHRTKNFACVTPAEADRILREFYGLGPAAGGGHLIRPFGAPSPQGEGLSSAGGAGALAADGRTCIKPASFLDLADFL